MQALPGEPYGRILINALAPIGDTLFATPAIRALRRAYPDARICAAVWPSNQAVLENNANVDELMVLDARRALTLARRLRSRRFDLAVHLSPYQEYSGPLLGIRRQLKLPCPWLFWLWPHRNRRWRHLHARDHYLETLRPLALHETKERQLMLKISGAQEAFAERFLREQGHLPGERLVGLHAGGSGFRGTKRWSAEGFAAVARQLGHVRLVFFGGPSDRDLSRQVVRAGVPDGFIDTCGRLTLSQAIGVLGRLDLFVGNDSGPLHLAAALGVPVVGIYGPTNPLTFRPLGRRVRVVTGAVRCPAERGFIGDRPLWDRRACRGECLASIDPDEVTHAARELLTESGSLPPSAKQAR